MKTDKKNAKFTFGKIDYNGVSERVNLLQLEVSLYLEDGKPCGQMLDSVDVDTLKEEYRPLFLKIWGL